MSAHTSCHHTAGAATPIPDLAADSPPSGGLCSTKMIVLVKWRVHIETIHTSAVKSFRRKTTGIQYLQVMNLSVNITHELINLNFAFGPSGSSASQETKISSLFFSLNLVPI